MMVRCIFLLFLFLGNSLLLKADDRPNVILILVDDMGFSDIDYAIA